MTHPYVSVEGVSRAYPGHVVFRDLWFGVNRGEFVCLVGHSGCGKTTRKALRSGRTSSVRATLSHSRLTEATPKAVLSSIGQTEQMKKIGRAHV